MANNDALLPLVAVVEPGGRAKSNDKSKVKPLSVDFPAVGSKQHCLLLLIDHAYTLLLMGKSLAGCCYDGL